MAEVWKVRQPSWSSTYEARPVLPTEQKRPPGSCSALCLFFFSSRRRHTRYWRDWSSDVCSSDLVRVIRGQRVADDKSGVVADHGEPLVAERVHQRDQVAGEGAGVVPALGLVGQPEIGRASCRKECRSRWSPYHYKKKTDCNLRNM